MERFQMANFSCLTCESKAWNLQSWSPSFLILPVEFGGNMFKVTAEILLNPSKYIKWLHQIRNEKRALQIKYRFKYKIKISWLWLLKNTTKKHVDAEVKYVNFYEVMYYH